MYVSTSTRRLSDTLARCAGKAILGCSNPYGVRNVAHLVGCDARALIAQIESYPSEEAPGRGCLPALRKIADDSARVVEMFAPLCPPV